MCENCKGGACKGGCVTNTIAKILVIIGGVNWGLVGIGMLLGKADSWNVVHLIFSFSPALEGIVYLLVGISAVMMIFSCKCAKCKGVCSHMEEKKEEVKI